jgi:hypothetical protein
MGLSRMTQSTTMPGKLAPQMIDQPNLMSMFPIETGDPKELARVLTALEAEPLLVPTQASINDQKRFPFSKDGVLKQLNGKTSAGLTL